MKKLNILITVTFGMVVLLSTPLSAQKDDFEDFIKKQREEFDKQKKEVTQEFDDLKKKADQDFAQLLSQAWQEMEVFKGLEADTTPKPVEPPVARPVKTPEKEPAKPPVKTPEKAPAKVPQKAPVKEPVPEEKKPQAQKKELPKEKEKVIQIQQPEGEPVSFIFYGTPVRISIDPKLKVNLTGTVSEKTISAFWETISSSPYEKALEQLFEVKKQLRMNDWGFCLLLDTVGKNIYGPPTTQRNLFVWFMLIKSGYDARIGFVDGQVYLLLPSKQTLFGVPFYTLNNKTYYITFLGTNPESVKSLYTYEGSHKAADKLIDMNIYQSPDVTQKYVSKTYKFSYSGKEYSIPVDVNQNIIDFYQFYPQTNFEVYFSASVDSESKNALLNGLKPVIWNQPEDEAVNMLLCFVQTAFQYQTDEEQFGKEKHLFAEETLYYPFSDCEDRSFLFAFLTRNLLGLDVIGLHYPGHVATAVKFKGSESGDSVQYNNSRYIICDPTYINAHYGECMPRFKNVNPEVVAIRTD
ncbi:hypothetical protein LLG96_16410 [bacterium]|nr:hypothetical protein [bacterium]